VRARLVTTVFSAFVLIHNIYDTIYKCLEAKRIISDVSIDRRATLPWVAIEGNSPENLTNQSKNLKKNTTLEVFPNQDKYLLLLNYAFC